MTAALQAGADAVLQLVKAIGKIDDETYGEGKPRDSQAMVAALEASLAASIGHADPDYRAGFLRALVSVVISHTDRSDVFQGTWDPLADTAESYASGAQEAGH